MRGFRSSASRRSADGGPHPAKLNVEHACDRVAEVCRRWGTSKAYSDQKDVDSSTALLARRQISLVGCAWTAQNKAAKFRLFRSLALAGRVHLCDERTTIAQLESICIKMTPSGTESFEGRGADDRACAIVLGVAEAVGTPGKLTVMEALRMRMAREGPNLHFGPTDAREVYSREELDALRRMFPR